MKKVRYLITCLCICFLVLASCLAWAKTTDYGLEENWAYWSEGQAHQADCFLLCPTVFLNEEGPANLSLKNEPVKANFVGALNMERGLYDGCCTMYAPFYQQASLEVYQLPEAEQKKYFTKAYKDVKKAFRYYLRHSAEDRPLVLAGFSQGADMALRLLEDFGADQKLARRLVACYALGWRVSPEQLQRYPHLRMAQGATDTGVIIAFTSEAVPVKTSLFIPEKTYAINPLNWRTDSSYAPAELNQGACFTDYSGRITREVPQLTGAYLEPGRGALKVDDSITPQEYPALLPICAEGVYHIYDYLFFYRNLQTNVQQRVDIFLKNR